jgi:hypothetical protein
MLTADARKAKPDNNQEQKATVSLVGGGRLAVVLIQ